MKKSRTALEEPRTVQQQFFELKVPTKIAKKNTSNNDHWVSRHFQTGDKPGSGRRWLLTDARRDLRESLLVRCCCHVGAMAQHPYYYCYCYYQSYSYCYYWYSYYYNGLIRAYWLLGLICLLGLLGLLGLFALTADGCRLTFAVFGS